MNESGKGGRYMDTMSVRIQRDRIQNETEKNQQFLVAGAKRQEEADKRALENGMIRNVEQNQKKNPDFLAERQTSDRREELRIKSRAMQEAERKEQQLARADYERSQGLERSNQLNLRAADVQMEREQVRGMAENEISTEKRETLQADIDRRMSEISEERRNAARINEANTAQVREERRKLWEPPTAQQKIDRAMEESEKKERVQQAARSKEAQQVNRQQRMKEQVTHMVENMRIASDDAKGIQYSSTM